MNECSAFLKAPTLLEPHHQIVQCHIQDICWGGGPTPMQRSSRCILQPHPTKQPGGDGGNNNNNNNNNKCGKLAQKEYKTKHNNVGKMMHWELCKKLKFDHTNKWNIENPESVQENVTHKFLWDFEI